MIIIVLLLVKILLPRGCCGCCGSWLMNGEMLLQIHKELNDTREHLTRDFINTEKDNPRWSFTYNNRYNYILREEYRFVFTESYGCNHIQLAQHNWKHLCYIPGNRVTCHLAIPLVIGVFLGRLTLKKYSPNDFYRGQELKF